MTTNLKIAKASLILIAASILGHMLSLGKEVLVAKYFGVSSGIDALYAALTIPNFAVNILLLMFSIMFIPIFVKYNIEDRQEANNIASILMNWVMLVLLVIAGVMFFFPGQIVSWLFKGLDVATAANTAGILRILGITILFSGIVGMLTYLLNAYEHFSWPALSQMLITICIIVFMLFFASSWGVYTIVWGTTLGLALQSLFLVFLVVGKGFRYRFIFGFDHPALKGIAGSVALVGVITLFSSINLIVNRAMASYLAPGSIAALAYADKLIQVPLIMFAGSVNTAIYPFFAQQVAQNKIEELKDTLASSIKMSGLIFVPVTFMFIIFAKPLVHALFQRGAFDSTATDITSAVLICFSFQLIAYYAMVIMMRLLFAWQDYKNLIKVLVVNILCNVTLNYIFIRQIKPPAAGIALSTSIVCFITTILFFAVLKRKMQYMHGLSILKSLAKTTLLSIIACAAMYVIHARLTTLIPYSTVSQLGLIAGSAAAGLILFTLLAYLIKFEEVQRLLNLIRNKVIPGIQ